jgi:ABC-type phosphate transport system substrate-binding protein
MKLLFALALLAFLIPTTYAQEAVFVVNPGVTETSITTEDAKAILLGNKARWESSGNIKLIVQTDSALNEKVIRDFTQRTPDQFDKYWKKLLFTGKAVMPIQAKTDAEVIDFVSKTPGAMGYAAKESVTDKVKVLAVK